MKTGTAALVFGINFLCACGPTPEADSDRVFEPKAPVLQAAPMCPWRSPEADLAEWFPGGRAAPLETKILSGQRVELEQALNRKPLPEETLLHLHPISTNGMPAGWVVTRRARGASGSIEVVIALDNQREVKGVKLQRLRETEAVGAFLASAEFMGLFRGADERNLAKVEVPLGEAAESAAAVVDAVHSAVVMLNLALGEPSRSHSH